MGRNALPGQVDSARCLGEAGISRKGAGGWQWVFQAPICSVRLLHKTLNPALGQGLWTQYG